MGNTFFLLLAYLINFVLIGLVVFLIYRVKILEKKLLTFSPTEAYAIMENMRELTVETQIIADKLDTSIKERESVLEDLSDLVDNKIAEFKKVNINGVNTPTTFSTNSNNENKFISSEEFLKTQNNTSNINTDNSHQDVVQNKNIVNNIPTININNQQKDISDIKSRIYELHKEGKNEIEIAKELGISTTEAKLAISLFK